MNSKLFKSVISFVLVLTFVLSSVLFSQQSLHAIYTDTFITQGSTITFGGHEIYFAERNYHKAVIQTSQDGLTVTLTFDKHTALVTIEYEQEYKPELDLENNDVPTIEFRVFDIEFDTYNFEAYGLYSDLNLSLYYGMLHDNFYIEDNSLYTTDNNFIDTFIINDIPSIGEISFYLSFDVDNNFEVANDVVSYINEAQGIFEHYGIDSRAVIGVTLLTILGTVLFNTLLATVATLVVASVTYVIATSITSDLQRRNHNHYMARLNSGQLFIGNSLSLAQARTRLARGWGNDVWSISSRLAQDVAGIGAVGPETGEWTGWWFNRYYMHFHTANRNGAHSFFGHGAPGRKR